MFKIKFSNYFPFWFKAVSKVSVQYQFEGSIIFCFSLETGIANMSFKADWHIVWECHAKWTEGR